MVLFMGVSGVELELEDTDWWFMETAEFGVTEESFDCEGSTILEGFGNGAMTFKASWSGCFSAF